VSRHEVVELREQRASVWEQMKDINDKAEGESRDLSAEEAQEFDKLQGDFDKLEKRYGRIEQLEGLKPVVDRRSLEDTPPSEVEQRGEQKVAGTLTEYRSQHLPAPVQDGEEYRAAFYKMLTSKDGHEITVEEQRTLSKATAAAGANLVPTLFENQLIQLLRSYGVMRELATVMTTDSGALLQIPRVASHGTAIWTAENAAFTPSDETFGQLSLSAYKLSTIIQTSEELMQDAAFDLESYIANEFAQRIGVAQNTAFVAGNGSGKPTGILQGVTVGVTGATGQTTTIAGDNVFDLYHALLVPYRRNAKWVGSDGVIKALRKVKESTGQYLWAPGLTAGEPDTLLGKPIYADPDFPAPAANAVPLIFGDLSYYWIRDVRGIAFQRLNELFAANGQVGFRAYSRSDGLLTRPEAIVAYANSAT